MLSPGYLHFPAVCVILEAVVKGDDVNFASSTEGDEFFIGTDDLGEKKFKNLLMTLLLMNGYKNKFSL